VTAVISLFAEPAAPAAAAAVIEAVSDELRLDPRPGDDGSWEFVFPGTNAQAQARVADALAAADPGWAAKLTLDYALAV
jgi:hypothetical protein